MAGITWLNQDRCVHMQGEVELEIKCRTVGVCVWVSCYSTVLLTAGHTHKFSIWLTIFFLFTEIHASFIPPEYACLCVL